MEQKQKKFKAFLFLIIVLAFALFIPGALANHIDFMDALWDTGDDPESLSLNQGETAELYVHVPFVPRGDSFTFAISAENEAGTQYLLSPSTENVPFSESIPLSTSSLAGEYEIVLQAVNAGGTDVETLNLNVNTAPQIVLPFNSLTVEDGQLISFSVMGMDEDKDKLTAYRPRLSDGSALPSGYSYTQVSASAGNVIYQFAWTPAYADVGRFEIVFKIDDEDASTPAAEATVTIVVLPHNLAPEVTGFGNGSGGTLSDTNSFKEGETLVAQVHATDADGDALNYEIERRYCFIILGRTVCSYTTELLDEMHFVPATGRFTFSPGFDFVEHPASQRTVQLRFRAFDGEFFSDWKEMTSQVRDVNQRPIADSMALTLSEDQSVTFVLPAHDNDAEDELTYELGGIVPAHGDLSNFDPATGRITYTPDANYYGLDSFTFVVQDDTGTDTAQSAQGTITFEIGGVNDLPTLNIPDAAVSEDFGTTTFNLRNYVSDIESPATAFTFAVTAQSTPSIVSCAMEAATPSFRLVCTSVANQHGSSIITITAIDGNGGTAVDTFILTVNPMDDPITILGQVPLSTPEETPLTLTLDGLVVEDPDNEYPTGFSLTIGRGANYTASGTTLTPATDFNGTLAVPVTLLQGGMVRGTLTLTVEVTPVNDAPLARDDAITVYEDNPQLIAVLSNDRDIDGTLNTSTVQIVSAPRGGTVVIHADGTITYTPGLNSTTSESFTYTVEDNQGALSNEARVVITLTPQNDVPQLTLGTQTGDEDSGEHRYNLRNFASDMEDTPDELSFYISGETRNDIINCEIAADEFTLVCTTQPNQNGESFVDIRVTDSEGAFRFFPVQFTVTPVNDAPQALDDSAEGIEDTPLNIAVLANDGDIDSTLDPSSVRVLQDPEYGTALPNSDGTITYTPNRNSTAADSFSYVVHDLEGLPSNEARVTITLTEENDAPLAHAQTLETEEDTSLSLILVGEDIDGSIAAFRVTREPLHGTLRGTAPDLSYTPSVNYYDEDSFAFVVEDNQGARSEEGEVRITITPVNDTPQAEDDTAETTEDTPITIDALANDSDVDGEELRVTEVSDASFGTVSIIDNALVYTPYENIFGVTDVFTYTIADPSGEKAQAIVRVTITALDDDSPLITDQSELEVEEDTSRALQLSDLIVVDPDGEYPEGFSIRVFGGDNYTSEGAAITPELNYNGRLEVPVQVVSTDEHSNTFILEVEVVPVNDAPVAQDDTAFGEEDEDMGVDVLENDTDVDTDDEGLLVTIVSGVTHGTLSCDPDGDCDYTPEENFTGTDSFTYSVSDGLLSDEATVTFTIEARNDQPQIIGQEPIEMQEDSSRTLTLSDLQVNDVDSVYPEEFTLELGEGENYTREGTTITPTLNFFGTLQIPVRVSDGSAESDEGFFLQVRVTPINDRPFFTSAPLLTSVEDQPYRYEAIALDVENSPLTFSAENLPAWLTFDPVTGILQGTPREENLGMHTVTLQVSDGELLEEQSFTLTVNAVDDSPLAEDAEVMGEEDSPLQITLQGSDPEGSTVTFSIISQPNHGTLSGLNSATGEVSYIPQLNYFGTDSFAFGISDGVNSAVATVQIIITPLNDAPIAQDDAISVREEEERIFSVTENDSDPDSTLQVTITSGVGHGTLACNEEGRCTYTPQENFTGTDSFTYTLSDGVLSDTATVTLTIEPQNDQPQIVGQEPIEMQEDSSRALTLSDLQVSDVDSVYPEEFTLELGEGENYTREGTTITPALNFFGTLQIPVRVSDGNAWSEWFTLEVLVTPVNDVPIADAQTIPVEEDTPQEITLTGSDVEASPLTFALVTTPAHGTLSGFNSVTGEVMYTPSENFTGEDLFTFTVADGTSESLPATVTLIVGAEDDAPILTLTPAGDRIIAEGEALHIAATATDVDSINLAFTVEERRGRDLAGATFESGEFNWTPGVLQAGAYELTFRVTDESGLSDQEEVRITVQNAPQIPVALEQNLSLDEDTQKEITLSGTDSDGNIVAYTTTRFPAHGRIIGTAPHLIYTPAVNFHGTDSFSFTVTDNDSLVSLPARVTLTISSINDAPVITSQPVTTALLGEEYTYQVTAQDDDPLNFSLIEAPEGMTMDTTGMITWTPRMTGTFAVEVEVSDGFASARQHYTITVQRGRRDLQLTSIHLNSEELSAGDTLVLSVQAANKGKASEQKLQITVSLPELGIERSVSVGKLKAGRSATKTISLPLPYDLPQGEYLLRVSLHNDSLHETEYRKIYMWG